MIANFIGIDKKLAVKFSHFDWLHHIPLGFSDSSVGKKAACNEGDPGLIPGWGRSHGEGIGYPLLYSQFFLVAQMVKNPSAMWETWVQSLGWEDPLEEDMATHFSILAWRIAMDRGAWWGAVHWGRKDSDVTELLSTAQQYHIPLAFYARDLKPLTECQPLHASYLTAAICPWDWSHSSLWVWS